LQALGLDAAHTIGVLFINSEGGPVLIAVLWHDNRIVCTSKPSSDLAQPLELRFGPHWYHVVIAFVQ
jgi:hypothetical protein